MITIPRSGSTGPRGTSDGSLSGPWYFLAPPPTAPLNRDARLRPLQRVLSLVFLDLGPCEIGSSLSLVARVRRDVRQ